MDTKQFLDEVRSYVEGRGFIKHKPPGLLYSKLYPLAPSAGHDVVDKIVISKKEPQPVFKFSVVTDRSIRMYDLDKISVSNRHLSFFETILIAYTGAAEELPKKEACEELFNLFLKLGLDPKRLKVTCLEYVKAEGKEIDSKEDEVFYKTWKKLICPENVKKTRGRRNLFYPRIIGAPGGTGCELYYQIGNRCVEIGSQVNYKFKFTGGLERTRNAAIEQGFGLERLLMAIEEKEHISEISLIFPIKERIRYYLKTYGEDDETVNLYDENFTKIVDSIRAISFVIHDANGNFKILNKPQRKILNGFKRVLNSEKSELNYLGIYDPKIYEDLIDVTIDLFKNRYRYMPQIKKAALEFINSTT